MYPRVRLHSRAEIILILTVAEIYFRDHEIMNIEDMEQEIQQTFHPLVLFI